MNLNKKNNLETPTNLPQPNPDKKTREKLVESIREKRKRSMETGEPLNLTPEEWELIKEEEEENRRDLDQLYR